MLGIQRWQGISTSGTQSLYPVIHMLQGRVAAADARLKLRNGRAEASLPLHIAALSGKAPRTLALGGLLELHPSLMLRLGHTQPELTRL